MILGGDQGIRRQFISTLRQIVPGLRVLWIAKPNDGVAVVEDGPSKRPITWDANANSRLTKQGHGYLQTFDGAANFGVTPDAADLTFGNGVTDSPFSVVTLANVTTVAATRMMVTKSGNAATNIEWQLRADVGAGQLMMLVLLGDASHFALRVSNAAIPTASTHLYGATYDGTGGALAANGMVMYQDGVAVASTPTNDALYVAMSDGTAGMGIGATSTSASPASFFLGSMGLVIVSAGVITAANMLAIKNLVNGYFGLAL